MKNYQIGGAKMCIFAYTSIMFDECDITQEQANKIGNILDDYQYNHKDSEKADYLVFAVANEIAINKGLKPLDFYKLTAEAEKIGISTK